MGYRRFVVTFALVLNVATLVMTVLILANASDLFEYIDGEPSGFDDFLVIGRGDATLLLILAISAIAGNMALVWALLTAGSRRRSRVGQADGQDRPRVTGE